MILLGILALVASVVFYQLGYSQGEEDGYINAMNDGWAGE